MNQHALQLLLPILVLLPVLYFRMRRMNRAQPLRLNRLWMRPALILAVCTLALLAPQPHPARHLDMAGWELMGLVAVAGAAAGWHWGRTMHIEVHPEDGTLMVKGSQAAMLVLVVLVLLKLGLRAGAREAGAWHLDALLLTDASIVFTAALFTLRSVEMYLRAKRVMEQAKSLP
jgi:hypothetical protein